MKLTYLEDPFVRDKWIFHIDPLVVVPDTGWDGWWRAWEQGDFMTEMGWTRRNTLENHHTDRMEMIDRLKTFFFAMNDK